MTGHRRKLLESLKNMVAKVKGYGKKGGHTLSEAFGKLNLSPKNDTTTRPLATTSGNAGRPSPESENVVWDENQARKKGKAKEHPGTNDPEHEVKALTSLDQVNNLVGSLQDHIDHWQRSLRITKVAQGSFGSVLRTESKKNPEQYTITKIIPLRPKRGRGSRNSDHTTIEDAAAELKTLALMGDVPGFAELRSAQVLRGSLPEFLVELDQKYMEANPEIHINTQYHPNQLWLVIEMTDAGTDLEMALRQGLPGGRFLNKRKPGKRLNIQQTWDIFWGVAEALQRGEEFASFEHRDLHCANICITMPATANSDDDVELNVVEKYTNLQVTLIDYTLSRATAGDGEVIFNPMHDRNLFTQESKDIGDQSQYDTYRQMRYHVEGNRDATQSQRLLLWQNYEPKTNVLWLSFLLSTLLRETETLRDVGSSQAAEQDAHLFMILKRLKATLQPERMFEWSYKSASDVVARHKMRNES